MGKDSKIERIVYFDILNIISIFSVIALHCNGIVHGNPNTRAWATSLVVECLCYFAVPLFIMLSGANLMNYREKYDTKTFFKKRFVKVLIPFLFWTIVMFALRIFAWETLKIGDRGIIGILNSFFNNEQESTYYFVWAIIGVYLTMPLLSLLSKEKYKKTLWFTVFIYFIFNAFIPNICVLFKINFNTGASVLLGGYVIYAILGYLLHNTEINKKHRMLIYGGALLGLIYRYVITFILSRQSGVVDKTIWNYNSWYCILLASSVFLIAKNINMKLLLNNKIQDVLKIVSGCSYGIFLIHQIIIHYEVVVLKINTMSWEWRTIGILTTYILSFIVIFALKKIPIIKRIVQ